MFGAWQEMGVIVVISDSGYPLSPPHFPVFYNARSHAFSQKESLQWKLFSLSLSSPLWPLIQQTWLEHLQCAHSGSSHCSYKCDWIKPDPGLKMFTGPLVDKLKLSLWGTPFTNNVEIRGWQRPLPTWHYLLPPELPRPLKGNFSYKVQPPSLKWHNH